jgi:hypothetical protein
MAEYLKVQNYEAFEEMLKKKDLRISQAIVKVALENLTNKKRFIHVLEVELVEEAQSYDITLDRNNLLDTLKQNLEIHELHEDYLGCIEINKAIKQLEILA